MSHRRSSKCSFEGLETRLLMAAQPSVLAYSTNWSGYAVAETAKDSVSAVSGSWNVPKVSTKSTSGYSADWVGIDGYASNTVEQLGTEEDTAYSATRDGTPQYYAWIEMYPGPSWIISGTVKPGDAISATVQFVGSSFTQYTAQGNASGVFTGNAITTTKTLNDNFQLTINDSTQKWSFATIESMANGSDARNSAEWIVEAPSGGSVLPLSNFGSVTFTDAMATINGVAGSIGSNPAAVLNRQGDPTSSGWVAMDMINKHHQLLDATSVLDAAGNSFVVDFGSQTPAAPNSVMAGSNLFSDTLLSAVIG
jgi:hypothetical protein